MIHLTGDQKKKIKKHPLILEDCYWNLVEKELRVFRIKEGI